MIVLVVSVWIVGSFASGPSPSPAKRVGPAPPVVTLTEKGLLKIRVETACGYLSDRTDNPELNELQKRVAALIQKLDAPESTEDLRAEGNDIVRRCAGFRFENKSAPPIALSFPSYFRFLSIGSSVLLAIIAALAVVLYLQARVVTSAIGVLIGKTDLVISRLSARETDTHDDVPAQENSASMGNQRETELIFTKLDSVVDKVAALLDREGKSDGVAEDVASPLAEEAQPDVRKIAENNYPKDVLRAVPANRQVPATYDSVLSEFVPNASGEMVILLNKNNSDQAIVIPKSSGLRSPDQFNTYYKAAYSCENPIYGSMFIVRPAVVEKRNDSWVLTDEGVLELKE